MDILYIILVAVAFIVENVGQMMKSKKYIIAFITVASLLYAASYVCLQKPIPMIANLFNLYRGIEFIDLEKHNKPYTSYILPSIIIIGGVALSVGLLWSSPFDLFVLAATIIVTLTQIPKSELIVRIGLFTQLAFWTVYNIIFNAYANLISSVLKMVIIIATIIYYNVYIPKRNNSKINKII